MKAFASFEQVEVHILIIGESERVTADRTVNPPDFAADSNGSLGRVHTTGGHSMKRVAGGVLIADRYNNQP